MEEEEEEEEEGEGEGVEGDGLDGLGRGKCDQAGQVP